MVCRQTIGHGTAQRDRARLLVDTSVVTGGHVLTMDVDAAMLLDGADRPGRRRDPGDPARRERDARHPGGPSARRRRRVSHQGRQRPPAPDRRPPVARHPGRPASRAAIFCWAVPSTAPTPATTTSCRRRWPASRRHQRRHDARRGGDGRPPRPVAAGMAAVGIRGTVGTWGWDVDGRSRSRHRRQRCSTARLLDPYPHGGLVRAG